MDISRQAYYRHNRVADHRSQQDRQIAQFVRHVRMRPPRLGTRKLRYLLPHQPETALRIGRDRLFRVFAEYRLQVRAKRAYHKTTHSFHRFYRHPNLLKPGPQPVEPDAPERAWVADITYMPSLSGPLYLSLVTDVYSRKIVGHHVHEGCMPSRLPGPSARRCSSADHGMPWCITRTAVSSIAPRINRTCMRGTASPAR